jgi:Fur family transcriptional regulator, peroxide stress response regulator
LNETAQRQQLNERLATSGFRFTPQRQQVYEVMLGTRDHPTADEVFIRSKQRMPDISMATVYNCLDALVKCGLIRQVNLDRAATRYCPNMTEHCHFYCDACGVVEDVEFREAELLARLPLPHGLLARRLDVAIHGLCRDCQSPKPKT